ncbi:MAG: Fe-S cluster assembly ATPase SufC [Candidatus Peregrinibacteria bacterium]|nr:Fe-S cluster assembly ATPase SufC [Candidatus Peregrinibacteria bacterium]
MSQLVIKDLHANVEDKEILKGISLTINAGEIHTIMGPNGSGKSTLCHVLMGHPKYTITSGIITLDGEDITELKPDKRAQLGIFLSFQYPQEVPGVKYPNFLRQAKNALLAAKKLPPVKIPEFVKVVKEKMKLLKFPENFMERAVNEGFSGGEKKRAEILQMAVFEPKFAILDETDSGLDVDALKIVAKGAMAIAKETQCGVLLITHYQRILNYIAPNFVHIMVDGKIAKTGGGELVEEVETKGYEAFLTTQE